MLAILKPLKVHCRDDALDHSQSTISVIIALKNAETLRVNYDDVEYDDQQALLDGAPYTGIVYAKYLGGKLESELNYGDGLPEGWQQDFYPDGSLQKKWFAIWARGSSEIFEYYNNGKPKSYIRCVDQIRAEEKHWNENGDLITAQLSP